MDNAKPCGGAIPLCMVDEFQVRLRDEYVGSDVNAERDGGVFVACLQLPPEIIDRRVTKMKMISPSNVAVDVGRTLGKEEYIGMVRRYAANVLISQRNLRRCHSSARNIYVVCSCTVICREVLDSFLRNRAETYGATIINGLYLRMDVPKDGNSPYVIHYSDYAGDSKVLVLFNA